MKPEIIGQRIALRREQLGLTQYELGDLTGMEQQHIWRYENGKNKPSLEKLIVLAEALRTSIDWLVGSDMGDSDLSPIEREAIGLLRRVPTEQKELALRVLEQFLPARTG